MYRGGFVHCSYLDNVFVFLLFLILANMLSHTSIKYDNVISAERFKKVLLLQMLPILKRACL